MCHMVKCMWKQPNWVWNNLTGLQTALTLNISNILNMNWNTYSDADLITKHQWPSQWPSLWLNWSKSLQIHSKILSNSISKSSNALKTRKGKSDHRVCRCVCFSIRSVCVMLRWTSEMCCWAKADGKQQSLPSLLPLLLFPPSLQTSKCYLTSVMNPKLNVFT